MSKRQGDGYRTETNKGLNDYYDNTFLPALLKMEDEQIKKYHVGDFIIQCEQKNIVARDGWKLKSLKVTGTEYTIRVYLDSEYEKGISLSVDFTEDKDEANKIFQQKVQMCK
jgi:phage-related protein